MGTRLDRLNADHRDRYFRRIELTPKIEPAQVTTYKRVASALALYDHSIIEWDGERFVVTSHSGETYGFDRTSDEVFFEGTDKTTILLVFRLYLGEKLPYPQAMYPFFATVYQQAKMLYEGGPARGLDTDKYIA